MQIIRDCLLCDRNGCRSTCASWTLTTCWMHRRYNGRATGRTRQLVCERSNDVLLWICLYHIAKCRDDLVTLEGNLVLHCGVRCKCISLHVTNIQSSSCLRVMNRNWSATKQRLHPQSVAEISRHSVLSGDRIRQCRTSSGSCHKDTDQCL